jgi:hypothetical protein
MMKKYAFLFTALVISLLASILAGCGAPSEEASGTVPWGGPASFEGAGLGLPQIDE